MSIVTALTQKGQITIPIAIRKLLGLKAADRLVFSVAGEKLVATPVKGDLLSLYGSVKPLGKKPADLKRIRREVVKEVASKIAAEGLS